MPSPGFRRATLSDADLLYRWRLEAEAQPWWEGTPTSRKSHWNWFCSRLANPGVDLLIWEEDDLPVGMCRIDTNGELSFHVADDAPAGAGVRMLKAAARYAVDHGGRLKITVDHDNHRQQAALERAGFRRYPAAFYAYKP